MEQWCVEPGFSNVLSGKAIELLKKIIAIPSFSGDEEKAVLTIKESLEEWGVKVNKVGKNIWCKNAYFDGQKPTLLLNSHVDTVKPNPGYTVNPFEPFELEDKLFGLGSNDAGGALVSLWATFLYFNKHPGLPYNLIYGVSAEEEVSGKNGIELLLSDLSPVFAGIVGEPTKMNIAIAEKGLMVVDGVAVGKAGHAARKEGINAINIALDDILSIRQMNWGEPSPALGEVKLSVTQINAGTQHNVVPEHCHFVIDVRTNEYFSNKDVFLILESQLKSKLKARSFRLNSTFIPKDHPLVQAGIKMGRELFGSPTTSDKALMNFPTIKMGPGDSARSHTANEFIYKTEIIQGIHIYINLLSQFFSEVK